VPVRILEMNQCKRWAGCVLFRHWRDGWGKISGTDTLVVAFVHFVAVAACKGAQRWPRRSTEEKRKMRCSLLLKLLPCAYINNVAEADAPVSPKEEDSSNRGGSEQDRLISMHVWTGACLSSYMYIRSNVYLYACKLKSPSKDGTSFMKNKFSNS